MASDGVEALSYVSEHIWFARYAPQKLFIDGKVAGVCEVIQAKTNIPIVMLTALDAEENQIKGLDLEADDDYITKTPFSKCSKC